MKHRPLPQILCINTYRFRKRIVLYVPQMLWWWPMTCKPIYPYSCIVVNQGGDTRIPLTRWSSLICWSAGHVSRQPNYRVINRTMLVWDWTKSRLFMYKGRTIRAYCFINIQNLESGSDLWDCNNGLHYSSVPINHLLAKLLWNVKFYLNRNFHELLS